MRGIGVWKKVMIFFCEGYSYESLAGLWHMKAEILQELGRTSEAEEAFAKAEELGYEGQFRLLAVCMACNPFLLFFYML